jgi:hypothetical protein
MLAVSDGPTAIAWYQRALGATVLWSLGAVAGLEIDGAAFFIGQPEGNGWETPITLGLTTARVEVFCDDPDGLIATALAEGAAAASRICVTTRPHGAFTARATSSIRSGISGWSATAPRYGAIPDVGPVTA